MIIDKANWERFIEGFNVVGGAIGFGNDRYCFVLERDDDNPHRDPLPDLRLLFARTERPIERRFFRQDFEGFNFSTAVFASTAGVEEFVVADLHGSVIAYGDWGGGLKVNVEKPGVDTSWDEGRQRAGIPRLKRVNGAIFAVALDRLLLERKGPSQWNALDGLERPKERLIESTNPLSFGFNDMDAFGPADMYAAGGKGDVWHFDGKSWRRRDFPSNEWLHTICCAGDGNVYITGKMGSMWQGRGDKWKKLADDVFSVPFNDSVWFAGKLWCSSDYGLYVLGQRGLKLAEVDSDVQLTARRLDVSPDGSRLLSCGNHGASVFDGRTWQLLFSALDMG